MENRELILRNKSRNNSLDEWMSGYSILRNEEETNRGVPSVPVSRVPVPSNLILRFNPTGTLRSSRNNSLVQEEATGETEGKDINAKFAMITK